MNWKEAPLVRPLIGFSLGIVIYSYYPLLSPHILLLLIGLLLLFFIPFSLNALDLQHQKYSSSLTLSLFFLLGCLHTCAFLGLYNPLHIENQNFKTGRIIGKIISTPKINKKVQVRIALQGLIQNEKKQNTSGKSIAFLEIDKLSKNLGYGDMILIRGKLDTIASSQHTSGFDFKKYYASKGITHTAQVEDWTLIEKYDGLYNIILRQRQHLLGILKKHLKTENEYAVGAALCLGNKDFLSDEIKNKFATVGAMHVLAVSGLHVGIIFSMLFTFLNIFKTRNKFWVVLKILITLLGIWLFVFLTGGSPSVLRAGIMFSFITISVYIRKYKNTYNTLAAAAILLLVYDPYLIYDVGFQLSFTAVAGIVYLHPKIYALLYFKWMIPDYLWQITSVGIAAQIATFPIGLYYFHHLPVNFLFTGLFVVPFAFIILSLGILLFIVQLVSSTLAAAVGYTLYLAIWTNNALINLVFLLPTNEYGSLHIGGMGMIITYLIIISVDRYMSTARVTFVLLSLGTIILTLCTF